MSKSIPADRGGNAQADVLDDGTLGNWILLAREVITLAATDYVAVMYPELAHAYVANWMRYDRTTCVEHEREFLTEFWNDGGGEFAEWSGHPDFADKLRRVVDLSAKGMTKVNRKSTIKRAYEAYAYSKRTGRERKPKCEEKKCARCGAEICPESTYCRHCAAIEREHSRTMRKIGRDYAYDAEHNRIMKKRGIIRA